MVLSATYEARRFGVTSAMPMGKARRLCPQAIVIEPDFTRYSQISDAIMATFHAVTDIVEPLSLDEAFLDIAGAQRRLGRPARIAQWVRDTVADEQGITCSVGVASTKFVAKLASSLAKPDGMIVVPQAEVLGFLHQLPVGALWGVGERTEEALTRLGLRTVADIAHTPVETLRRGLGDVAGAHLHALAWGRDERIVVRETREKSIGSDETFSHDIDDPVVIHRELLRLSDRTAARVRAAGMMGRTVTIKVRFADFTTITRSRTLRDPTDVSPRHLRHGPVAVRRPGPPASPDPAGRGSDGGPRGGGGRRHPGDPRRARARLARRRQGGGPGQRTVRRRGGPAGRPGPRPR